MRCMCMGSFLSVAVAMAEPHAKARLGSWTEEGTLVSFLILVLILNILLNCSGVTPDRDEPQLRSSPSMSAIPDIFGEPLMTVSSGAAQACWCHCYWTSGLKLVLEQARV